MKAKNYIKGEAETLVFKLASDNRNQLLELASMYNDWEQKYNNKYKQNKLRHFVAQEYCDTILDPETSYWDFKDVLVGATEEDDYDVKRQKRNENEDKLKRFDAMLESLTIALNPVSLEKYTFGYINKEMKKAQNSIDYLQDDDELIIEDSQGLDHVGSMQMHFAIKRKVEGQRKREKLIFHCRFVEVEGYYVSFHWRWLTTIRKPKANE